MTAPSGSIRINGGARFTADAPVGLELAANDGTGSGVEAMRIGNDGMGWTEWMDFGSTMPWTLPEGDGVRQVHAQFRDRAGNTSLRFTASITLTTSGPSGSVLLNNGGAFTNQLQVVLTLDAAAPSGVALMRTGLPGTLAAQPWKPFAVSDTLTLPPGDGVKTVAAQFQDTLGLVSPVVTDDILLDTTAPTTAVTINDAGVAASL